jgi:protein-S-isoprenylcysteine O-methyltransferase Ste14
MNLAVAFLWLAWVLYWWVSSRNVKPTQWREPLKSQLAHRAPLILGAILFAVPQWLPGILRTRFVPATSFIAALGAFLVAAGLAFSVWARRHLGRNWSAEVVVKEGHALIRTGPYRRLRHPIYAGILLAFLGTAITIGEWRALLAFFLMLLSFGIKSRAEEHRMLETFPEYAQYRRESSAIIPFIW